MNSFTNEQEILDALERQTFLIEKKLDKGIISIQEINDLTETCAVNTNNLEDFTLSYIGKNHEQMLGFGIDVLKENPLSLIKKLVYPGDFAKGVRLVKDYLLGDSAHDSVSYIQRTKALNGTQYIPFYTLTRVIKSQNILTSIVIPLHKLGVATNKMVRSLEETDYMRKNYHRFNSLTVREKEIITFLALGYQNNEIAEQLFIAKATVEQHRKNLKRKLEIKRFVDLIRFAQAFDLI